ncbi:ABC transporter permease [Pseudoleptotrichia goodfellowii]|uniref:ABC transporter, permease protein n=1 Tax=Pseudoleptotrichia goodfellowii F0264 TaxID=596323 RepID=D0GPL4_9FUSO|nr:iron ABC transporter permease [Pseudoleptotrichia goodfellowii]EEY33954.1 ABC transporter, permease protein [Pseudoleptotrichia goodfellowii F0264]MBF4805086.1 iron ABC transporter permease [Pseudoleptotrichia goodfellowii]
MNKIIAKNNKFLKDPILLFTILLVILSLFLFIVLPLYEVFKQSIFDSVGKLTFEAYKGIFTSRVNIEAVKNTLILATTVGITSTFIGYIFAYTEAYIKMRGKKIFNLIALLPIISPPFAISLSIILLFGSRGLITKELLKIQNFNIYGFQGLVMVQTLSFFPMAYLLLNGVLKTIDPSMEEASENLGGTRKDTFFKVTFPLTKSAIMNSFLLVFIKSISDFGNPIAIGGDYSTLAVQIYQQALGNYDMAGAAALSMVLLDISLILFILSKYYFDKKSYVTVTGKAAKKRELIEDKIIKLPLNIFCGILSFIIMILYILIPIGSFIKLWGINYSFTTEHYIYALNVGGKAILDTVIFSVMAAPVTGILAIIISFLIVRKRFIGKNFIDFTSILGIAVPGTVIGIGYVLAFNTPPIVLTGTATIIVIAFIARTIPVGIKSGINTLQQIDPAIEEAAQDLGANSFKVFTTITLPMIKSAFLGGMVYSFIKSMTSLSAVIFLISAKYNLLTIAVLDQVEVGKFGVASAFSTILILIVYVVITVMQKIVNRQKGGKTAEILLS